MLKRFTDAIRKQSSAMEDLVGMMTSAQRSSFIVASTQDPKNEAFKTLRAQIKDMSTTVPTALKSVMPPPEQLVEWNVKLPSELDSKQLELLAKALFDGDVKEVGHDMEKAVRLWEHADKLGNLEAKYYLACCVRDGVVYRKDIEKAYHMFEEIAHSGEFPVAHYMVGKMLESGEGTEKDEAKAFASFKSAAEQGVTCYLELAKYYVNGKVVPKNEELAVQYFELAAAGGNMDAIFPLATHLLKGEGCAQDKPRAASLLNELAERGHMGAQYNLGLMHVKGDGVEKDVKLAAAYFEKARLQGLMQAGINCIALYRGLHGHPKELGKAAAIIRIYLEKSNGTNDHLKTVLKEVEDEMAKK